MELLTIVFTSFPIIAILAVIALLLPYFMRGLGFHPDYDGEKFDCGSKKGFVHATIALALRDESISEDIKKIIKEIV